MAIKLWRELVFILIHDHQSSLRKRKTLILATKRALFSWVGDSKKVTSVAQIHTTSRLSKCHCLPKNVEQSKYKDYYIKEHSFAVLCFTPLCNYRNDYRVIHCYSTLFCRTKPAFSKIINEFHTMANLWDLDYGNQPHYHVKDGCFETWIWCSVIGNLVLTFCDQSLSAVCASVVGQRKGL